MTNCVIIVRVILASIDAYHPTANLVHYDTSKGDIRMMTKTLALELASRKITVNAVAPGGISTPGTDVTIEAKREQMVAAGMSPEDFEATFTTRIPLSCMGVPDDIVKVILFLTSGLSEYMTGTTLVADGGYLLS
ncbi:MAG: SDR family NAD(P)-dependent oxidoreductase [Promethearchaeota archaeon]